MPEFDASVEYREIVGYPSYRVGSDGSVWSYYAGDSVSRRGTPRNSPKWKKLNTYRRRLKSGEPGYMTVALGRGNTRYVHRLVLEAFVGPCPPGMLCRHFPDRDQANNRLNNLQWGTPVENSSDREEHETVNHGERNGQAKLTAVLVKAIREDHAAGMTYDQLGVKYVLNKYTVGKIVRRERWQHIS